jgi:hypothetical protein
MYPKNIIKPKHQMAIGSAISLLVGNFYLDKEVLLSRVSENF